MIMCEALKLIYSDLCVEICLGFLMEEQDAETRVELGYALLNHFSFDAIEPARQLVQGDLEDQDPNMRDGQVILTAVAKALGKPAPSAEKILEELRARNRRLRERRVLENPVVKLAPNPELGVIMHRMLYTEGNRSENAKRRSKELLEWAGENQERRAALKKYCKAVLAGDFEINLYVKTELEKLSSD